MELTLPSYRPAYAQTKPQAELQTAQRLPYVHKNQIFFIACFSLSFHMIAMVLKPSGR
jgi:hypothetical protein